MWQTDWNSLFWGWVWGICLWSGCFGAAYTGPFVTAHLMGQLGNQFFIIAAASAVAWDHGAEPLFPELYSLTHDPICRLHQHRMRVFSRVNPSLLPRTIAETYYEPQFSYDSIPYSPDMCLYGWFQSEKYFKKYKEKIVALFSPSKEVLDYLQAKYSSILDHPKTVSVHMRTYLVEKTADQRDAYVHYGREYVEAAMSLFPEDSLFVVFSNKMDWAKRELSGIERNILFIEGEAHYHDLYLMSLCKDNIICNSSFSWWAAYLNPNPFKRVIVPPAWFSPQYVRDTKDLIPLEWEILHIPMPEKTW